MAAPTVIAPSLTAPLPTVTGGVINSAACAEGIRVTNVPIAELGVAYRQHPDWFLWVGLYEPPEEVLRLVQQAFGLHDLAIEDAHGAHQRPKLEVYGESLFVVLRTVRLVDLEASFDGHRIEFGETHVFVDDRYLVSVRHGSLKSHVGLRARCETTPHLLAKGPSFVLHALMDFIVNQYAPIVETLETELRDLERDIFERDGRRNVTGRLYRLRRDLVALRGAISPIIDISSQLMRTESGLIPADTRIHFQDVNDHVLRMAEIIDNLQELSGTALETNLALISLSQNEDTKRLAAWAVILAVPTMIAGFFGMNFRNMPELNWKLGYPLVLGMMGSICLLLYRGFKKSRWL